MGYKKIVGMAVGSCLILMIGVGKIMSKETKDAKNGLTLTSPAFADGKSIPSAYSCDGADELPLLQIENIPREAKSLALIIDDPDAPMGTFVHLVLFNIPPAKKITIDDATKLPGTLGKNSWGKKNYGGPCPPSGTHRYFFTLYALNAILTLDTGASADDLKQAMKNHILEKTVLMGTYQRKK